MPTYDYRCNDCKLITEVFHSMKERMVRTCPSCHKDIFRYFGRQKVRFNKPMHEFLDIGSDEPRIISSKRQIKEIEKREGKVFGDHQELRAEANKNKEDGLRKMEAKRDKELMDDCIKIVNMES